MPKPFLIIDGYNLMHAAGMARLRYGPGDFERSRNRLLGFLCDYLYAAERERTTIVFDAANAPPGLDRTTTLEGMTILFSPPDGDADTTIEELVREHSAPKQIRLVSSDHRLQKAVRRRRGRFVDSEQFFAQLEARDNTTAAERRRRKTAIPPFKLGGDVSREEVAAWLEVFGDIDGLSEANESMSGLERLQREVDELVDEAESGDDE